LATRLEQNLLVFPSSQVEASWCFSVLRGCCNGYVSNRLYFFNAINEPSMKWWGDPVHGELASDHRVQQSGVSAVDRE
jgi:hypothetical protein